jgi:hypothetical protein
MKKVGAWAMIVMSVLVGLVGLAATLSGALTIVKAISGQSSAYGMGYAVGQLVAIVIIFAIAWKLFKKGRSLLSSTSQGTAGSAS